MGLEEIIDKIESDTETKVKQIIDDAKSQAAKTLSDAKANANQRIKETREKAENDSKQIVNRETSRAMVEASQIYQERLSSVVSDAISMIKTGISSYTSNPSYAKLLAKLADMAIGELGDSCIIYLQKEDMQKFKAQKFNVAASQEQFSGGLKAVSKDQTMYVDYTLDKIIEGMSDRIAFEVLKMVKE